MKNYLISIVLWAFILNTLWEFGQCVFLYNMWSWSFWKATFWMWGAVFGDILIVLGLWKGTTTLFASVQFSGSSWKDYMLLTGISFLAGILLEWAAIYLDLWTYDRSMPVFSIFGYQVGLSPILQITFLPALSIYLSNSVSFGRIIKSQAT